MTPLRAVVLLAFATPLAAQDWTRLLTPPLEPAWRYGAQLVHDGARGRTLWFGGTTDAALTPQTTPLGDYWEFDGKGWAEVRPRVVPPARYMHGVCYDPLRSRVLMFGGQDRAYHNLDDLWQFDGITWSQIATANRPPSRRNFAMAFDSARDHAVVFGGVGAIYYGDTWQFDGTDWQAHSAVGPTAREGGQMAFDAARQRTVLFGGYNPGSTGLDPTWEFDGTVWSQRAATSPSTQPAFDPVTQHVVTHDASWDGSAWSTLPRATGWAHPAPALLTVRNDGTRLAVGRDGNAGTLTSLGDGMVWRSASRRVPDTMVWDEIRQRVLGIGRIDGGGEANVWLWDRREFQPLAAAGFRVYFPQWPLHDTVRDRFLFFDHSNQRQLHQFRGSDWQLHASVQLPYLYVYGAAFDAGRGVLVLEGVDAPTAGQAQTWEFDGAVWQHRSPTNHPLLFQSLELAYDPARQCVVGFTGMNTLNGSDDTWEYDGIDWQLVSTNGHPFANAFGPKGRLTFDAARGVIVRYHAGQTWEYDGIDWVMRANGGPAALLMAPDPIHSGHLALGTNEVWHYGVGPLPTVARFGSGCPSSSAVVSLDGQQPALLGRDTHVRLRGLPPEPGLAFLVTGFDDGNWNGSPLPQSLGSYGLDPACMIWLAPSFTETLPHSGSTAVASFALPANGALAGIEFFQQALCFDPTMTGTAPFATSNALGFVTGN